MKNHSELFTSAFIWSIIYFLNIVTLYSSDNDHYLIVISRFFSGNIFQVKVTYLYHSPRFLWFKIQDVSSYLSKGISSREGCKRFSIFSKILKPKNPILHQHEVKVFWEKQTRLVKMFTCNRESNFLLFLTEILTFWSCQVSLSTRLLRWCKVTFPSVLLKN